MNEIFYKEGDEWLPISALYYEQMRKTQNRIKHLERRCSLLDKPPLTQSMVIWAFRYCLGRSTYAVSDCVSYLLENWKFLEEHTKELIVREIDEAFEKGHCGMRMDQEQWNRILEKKEAFLRCPFYVTGETCSGPADDSSKTLCLQCPCYKLEKKEESNDQTEAEEAST